MKKTLKIIAGILLSLVLLIVAGIAALVFLIDPNDYKPQLQALAAKQQVELHIEGDLSWTFYPHIGIRADKFSVKPPMKNISKPLQFDSFIVSVKLLPLFHRQIIVNNIAIRASEITLRDPSSKNETTITNLLIESRELNLNERPFPFSLSLNAHTTEPLRDIRFKASTQVSLDREIKHVFLNNFLMHVDDTEFKGNIEATLGKQPFLKVSLAGTRLDIDHYFPASAQQHKGKTLTRHEGAKEDEFIPATSIKALPGDYHFSFEDLTLKHLHGDRFSVSMLISPEGLLTFKELTTGAYGGQFTLHGTIDTRQSLPDVKLKMALQHLNLEPAMKDYFQLEKTFVTGDFAFNADVTTRGLSWEQLMQAMNGEFSFASEAITLKNFDITSSLDKSLLQLLQVKLPKLTSAENETVMSDMKGDGVIQQGVMNNTNFSALGPCSQFKGAGTYNLSNADVLYHMGITFPSTDTNEACSEINKKLKDIAWPVACKGSLDDGAAKICSADSDAMQSLIKKAVSKEAGEKLEKKLDDKLQKKFGKDADAIKNSLKGLF